jgi:hypothetical protein
MPTKPVAGSRSGCGDVYSLITVPLSRIVMSWPSTSTSITFHSPCGRSAAARAAASGAWNE